MHSIDFNKTPFLVCWETTHACDLECVHCRASAETEPDPEELNHKEALKLIKNVKDMGAPILVFTGGDPLKRRDLTELIRYATSLGLRTGTIPAATPLLTLEKIKELKAAGLDQIAFSLDAANPEDHDAFRKVEGVFRHTLKSAELAKKEGLATQINSLINVHNTAALDPLIDLVRKLGIVFWEVFFLVPTGRGRELPLLSALKFEEAFQKIYSLSKNSDFIIKITEAPHYRRFYIEEEMKRSGLNPSQISLERRDLPEYLRKRKGPGGSIGRAPEGVNSGKGFVFVSNKGEVFPSGFLPLKAGSVREKTLKEIYCDSSLMKELRDPGLLKGRCGICPYRDICGGSRSRAYALTGDYLGEDPCCIYEPAKMKKSESVSI